MVECRSAQHHQYSLQKSLRSVVLYYSYRTYYNMCHICGGPVYLEIPIPFKLRSVFAFIKPLCIRGLNMPSEHCRWHSVTKISCPRTPLDGVKLALPTTKLHHSDHLEAGIPSLKFLFLQLLQNIHEKGLKWGFN